MQNICFHSTETKLPVCRQAGMHWNPCKGENKIVELPEQYAHSSAKFYITGEQGIYHVTSYTELGDIDLTN
jgi:hypothetical protein